MKGLETPYIMKKLDNENRKNHPDYLERKKLLKNIVKEIKNEAKLDEAVYKLEHKFTREFTSQLTQGIETLANEVSQNDEYRVKKSLPISALLRNIIEPLPKSKPGGSVFESETILKPKKKSSRKDRLYEFLASSGFEIVDIQQLNRLLTDKNMECVILPFSVIQAASKFAKMIVDGGLEALRVKYSTRVPDPYPLFQPTKLPKILHKKVDDSLQKRLRPLKPMKIRFNQSGDILEKGGEAEVIEQNDLEEASQISDEEQYLQYLDEEAKFNFGLLSKSSLGFLKQIVKHYVLDSFFNFEALHETNELQDMSDSEHEEYANAAIQRDPIININVTRRKIIEERVKKNRDVGKELYYISNLKCVPFSLNTVDFARSSKRLWIDQFVGLGMRPEEEGEIKKLKQNRFYSR